MRNWSVIGFKNVNYKSKKTGNQVEGYNLYLTSPSCTPDVVGEECKEVFINRAYCSYKPTEGDEVNIIYNDRGFVEDIVSSY